MKSNAFLKKIKSLVAVSSCSSIILGGLLYYNNDEQFFDNFAMPLLRLSISPENIHKLGVFLCKWNLIPKNTYIDPPNLATKIFDISLKNPVGIAAGFDKSGEMIKSLHKLGFGFVEIGTLMPEEQEAIEGHKPKMILLNDEEAIISCHVNEVSKGHADVIPKLRALRHRYEYEGIFGINLGVNRYSDFVNDSATGMKMCSKNANYLVININPPENLPQFKENLHALIAKIHEIRKLFDEDAQRPIFFKLSPDLKPNELKEIVSVTRDCKIHGFIVSNSSHEYDNNLKSKYDDDVEGWLSGVPLRDTSTKMIQDVYKLTHGENVIIGCGGIRCGQDAFDKILAGASAVQIYTSFIYHGSPVVIKIKRELSELLIKNGFANVSEAVGKGVEIKRKKFKWLPFL